jgi:hypothetical protein
MSSQEHERKKNPNEQPNLAEMRKSGRLEMKLGKIAHMSTPGSN